MADVHDCFISHASEDKDAIARPLAHALRDRGYDIWYDEFELEVGDSLPGKIDEGLAGSRFGVVVLSERFFEKQWSKAELEALVARQMIGSERIILPVWHEIDEEFLEGVSPMLASIVGVPSSPLDVAVEKIARKIDHRKESGSSGAALVAAQASRPAPAESDPEGLINRNERVKLAYTEDERQQFHAEGGSPHGPGWLSVVVGPTSLRDDLIDPTEIEADRLRDLTVEEQWYPDVLLNRRGLRANLDGFHHRFPDQVDSPPAYWLKIWQDGLLEFGETLSLDGTDRSLAYESIAEQIHDYVLLFLRILTEIGYQGDVVAVVTFGNIRGFEVGIPPRAYFPQRHPIEVDRVRSRTLRASVNDMPGELNRWVKKTMDRVFLAAGIASGSFFMTDEGNIRQD